MTEQEWLACTDPELMLEYLRGKASDRRLRLFACACCSRIRGLPVDPRGRRAVETAEKYADGQCDETERRRASEAAWRAAVRRRGLKFDKRQHCDEARAWSLTEQAVSAALAVWQRVGAAFPDEREALGQLFRDIFGNPFRPVSLASAWRTPAVLNLAQAAYDNRRLPSGLLDDTGLGILADALEEAGCTDADILSHLRGPGPHVRGCWLLDLILNKE